MADLYGAAPSLAAAEPEEISTFLHHLLHHNNNNNNGTSSSSSSVPPYSKFMHHQHYHHQHAPPEAAPSDLLDRRRFGRSESDCRLNFSDPGGYFAKEAAENAVSSSGGSKRRSGSVENCLGDFSCDSEKGAEVSREVPPSEPARPRSLSKRSRAAEVHNLSEKRRRSRINEKMKALQTLIPNSNKTDKASMLDEAIEYLKQLQLQVQMLTMRNGLSLHPMCLPGVLQPMQLPLTGMSFDDDGSGLLTTNTAGGTFSANEEGSAQTALNLPNQGSVSNQAVVIPSGTNINSSEPSFGFEPLIHANYGPFNLSTSSKEICREGTPQPQMNPNQAVKKPASGVS